MPLDHTTVLFRLNTDSNKNFAGLSLDRKRSLVVGLPRPDIEFRGSNPYASAQQKRIGGLGGLDRNPGQVYVGRNGTRMPISYIFSLSEEAFRGGVVEHLRIGSITCRVINAGRSLAANIGADGDVEANETSWSYAEGFALTPNEIEGLHINPRLVCWLDGQNNEAPSSVERFIRLPRPPGSRIAVDFQRIAGEDEVTVTLYTWNSDASCAMKLSSKTANSSTRMYFDETAEFVYPVATGVASGNEVSLYLGADFTRT